MFSDFYMRGADHKCLFFSLDLAVHVPGCNYPGGNDSGSYIRTASDRQPAKDSARSRLDNRRNVAVLAVRYYFTDYLKDPICMDCGRSLPHFERAVFLRGAAPLGKIGNGLRLMEAFAV